MNPDEVELRELVARGYDALAAAAPPDIVSPPGRCRLETTDALLLLSVIPPSAVPRDAHGDRYASCWRRVHCPAHFSLLQLHVLIQASFGFRDASTHQFYQADTAGAFTPPPIFTLLQSAGRSEHGTCTDPGDISAKYELIGDDNRDALLLDAGGGSGVALVEHSSPAAWHHLGGRIGRPDMFAIQPTALLEERAFRVRLRGITIACLEASYRRDILY